MIQYSDCVIKNHYHIECSGENKCVSRICQKQLDRISQSNLYELFSGEAEDET